MAEKHIVIIGGGVMGAATAYYLTHAPSYNAINHKITVLEAIDVAHAASGKAGGLLSGEVEMHTPETVGLAKLSWKLHAELAEKYGGEEKWWYRRLDMLSIQSGADEQSNPPSLPSDLDTKWLNTGRIVSFSVDGTKEMAGQVTGFKFTNALLDLAKSKGAHVILGKVTGATYADDGITVTAIHYLPKSSTSVESISVTNIVLAAGPWSGQVFEKIKPAKVTYELPIFGTRSHSILIDTEPALPPLAVFAGYKMKPSEKVASDESDVYDLEFYPRPDHLYVCGPVDRSTLPAVDKVGVDSAFCDRMYTMTSKVVSEPLASSNLRQKQSCYMPMVETKAGFSENGVKSGPPLIGKLPQIKNAVVATGHSCWGMTLSAATGYVVAEIVLTGESTSSGIDLKGLSPERLLRGNDDSVGRTKKWNISRQ